MSARKVKRPKGPPEVSRLLDYIARQQTQVNHAAGACRALRAAMSLEDDAESAALLLARHLNDIAESLDVVNLNKLLASGTAAEVQS